MLIDDGSPDDSPAICDEYALKDGRVKVFHKPNGGVSSARNLGIEKAQGKYVGFVDSDDYISPDMYKTLIDLIEENGADISVCGFKCIDESTGAVTREQNGGKVSVLDKQGAIDKMFDVPWSIRLVTYNKLFMRKKIANLRFDESLKCSEDTKFLYEYLKETGKLVYIEKPLYVNIHHTGSAMNGSLNPSAYYQSYFVASEIIGFAVEQFPPLKRRAMAFFLDNTCWKIEKVCSFFNKGSAAEDIKYYKKMRAFFKRLTFKTLFCVALPLRTRISYFMLANGLKSANKYKLKNG